MDIQPAPTLHEAVRDGLLDHEWNPGHNFSEFTAHSRHNYESSCALCQGDAERITAVVLEIAGEQPPTQWAYDQACAALEKHRQRADQADAALARVRELHRPYVAPADADTALCRTCDLIHPCPTIRAIDGGAR